VLKSYDEREAYRPWNRRPCRTLTMKHHIIKLALSLIIIVAIVGGLVYWRSPETGPTIGSPAAEADPVFTWTPSSMSEVIGQGQTKTVQVSFTASENVNNVVLRVVPELQPFVQVSPSTVSSVSQGQSILLNVTVSAAADAALGTATGTIQLRSGID